MTDTRRTRPAHACEWPGCPHLGQWRSPWCPQHHAPAVAQLRQAVDAARRAHLAAMATLLPDDIGADT